ncbi:MAG TPA: hypothetical protein VN794_11030 [Methylomirabilota bacterium]|nr:hypothetical protein [Methylomirabilota bacterium]
MNLTTRAPVGLRRPGRAGSIPSNSGTCRRGPNFRLALTAKL